MEKTISTSELKSDPDAVLREVSAGDEVVFVESAQAPTAAIISLDEYRRLREVDDRQRRQERGPRNAGAFELRPRPATVEPAHDQAHGHPGRRQPRCSGGGVVRSRS